LREAAEIRFRFDLLNRDLESLVAGRTAELREALAARDEFIVVAAHELRTPLTSLRLAAESLDVRGKEEASGLRGPARRLSTIVEQSRKLDALIDELLDLSRIHTGQLDVPPEGIDLCPVVSGAAARLEREARKAGCNLVVEIGEPVLGLWDPRRIDQA